MTTDELPDSAWSMALLTLPGMGPARLNALLELGSARAAWEAITSGAPIDVPGVNRDKVAAWRSTARRTSVEDHWRAAGELGLWVAPLGSDSYPERLRDDIEAPHMLFGLGRSIGTGPTVGIVGTRNCTSYGRRCAFEFGNLLAEAGVSVVSGLALGIDAAAHQGALNASGGKGVAARPIGVVGSGLDVIYPKRNSTLWSQVAEHGSLLSETAPGVQPARWRFPARNRIIAGLSDAVIVIESHEAGGSLSTVEEAQARDIPVGAVPGPITSNASAGTNLLLADGATPILGVEDIFALIGHHPPAVLDMGSDDQDRASVVLDALGWNPILFDELCQRLDASPGVIAVEVEQLIDAGLCSRDGPWIERS